PKAKKSILLSTGIARLLARHDPPLGHPARRSFAAKGQNAFLYQQKSPAYWRRNGPPLGHAVSRRSFAAEGQKHSFSQQESPDYWRRNGAPLRDAASRRSFAAKGQMHSSQKTFFYRRESPAHWRRNRP